MTQSWISTAKSLVNAQLKRFLIQHSLKHDCPPALFQKVCNAFSAPLPHNCSLSTSGFVGKNFEQVKKVFFEGQINVLRKWEKELRLSLGLCYRSDSDEFRLRNFFASRRASFKASCHKLCGCVGPQVTFVSFSTVVLEISKGCNEFKLVHGNRRALQEVRTVLSQSDESIVEILCSLSSEETLTGGVRAEFVKRKVTSILDKASEKSRLPDPRWDNCVFNFSKKEIPENVLKVLSKGLKFVPSRKWKESDLREIQFDAARLTRSILLKDFFEDKEAAEVDFGIFDALKSLKPPSSFCPNGSKKQSTTNFIRGLDALLTESEDFAYKSSFTPNISRDDFEAIKKIGKDETVVIKPADKGSGVVILDTDEYIRKCQEILDSPDYVKLEDDPLEEWSTLVDGVIAEGIRLGLWSQAHGAWLKVKDPKMPVLYGLPKVHKAGVPLRPVVSSINCPTMHLAKLIDITLQPLVTSSKVYLRDTKHFLQVLEGLKSQDLSNCKLFSLDVEALYPSVPHEGAVEAVKTLLMDNGWDGEKLDFFLKIVGFVLENSFFQFNGVFFKQTRGVPIGSKCGCTIASVFMLFIEKNFVENFKGKQPKVYFRYIDDIFGVWDGSQTEFEEYFESFNCFNPFIKFTNTGLQSELNVLDTTVCLNENGILKVKLFTKPTDRKMLLNYQSSHPMHVKRAIPYMMSRRIMMICSEPEDRWAELETLGEVLFRRSYPRWIVESGFLKAMMQTREDCLQFSNDSGVNKDETPHFFLVTKFLSGVDWRKLRGDIRTVKERTKFSGEVNLAFRKDKSLKSWVVRSNLTKNEGKAKKQFCGRKNCPICKQKECFHSGELVSEGKKLILKSNYGCKESSVVYYLFCPTCNLGYVGATKRELSKRFSEHLGKINNNSQEIQTVHLHFKNKDKNKKCFPKIGILEKVLDQVKLFQVEKWYIKKLRPHFNVKDATFVREGDGYKEKPRI